MAQVEVRQVFGLATALTTKKKPIEVDNNKRAMLPDRGIYAGLIGLTAFIALIAGLLANGYSGWDGFFGLFGGLTILYLVRDYYIRAPEEVARTIAEVVAHTSHSGAEDRPTGHRVAEVHWKTVAWYGGHKRFTRLLADWTAKSLVLGNRGDKNGLLAIYFLEEVAGATGPLTTETFRDGITGRTFADVD